MNRKESLSEDPTAAAEGGAKRSAISEGGARCSACSCRAAAYWNADRSGLGTGGVAGKAEGRDAEAMEPGKRI